MIAKWFHPTTPPTVFTGMETESEVHNLKRLSLQVKLGLIIITIYL